MWLHLLNLIAGWPLVFQVGFISGCCILVLFTIIFISIKGQLILDWSKKKIGLGKSKSVNFKKKCSDCLLGILTRREECDLKIDILHNTILRDQKIFLDLKTSKISFDVTNKFVGLLAAKRDQDKKINYSVEHLNRIIFQEIFKNSIILIKGEMIRSFIENGFYNLSSTEFKEYVDKKIEDVVSIIKNYIFLVYPYEDMIVPIDEIFLEITPAIFSKLIFDIYNNAKEIYIDATKEIEVNKKQFITDICYIAGIEDINESSHRSN